MKKIYTILLLLASIGRTYAQTFPCDNGARLYFFQAGSQFGTTTLSYFSNYTSTPTVTTLFNMPSMNHNGLAANIVDDYLYYQDASVLKRLDASGNVTTACTLSFSSLYGCFDMWGRYWSLANNNLVAVNIQTGSIVKGPFTIPASSNSFLDLAFDPFDCFIYVNNQRCDTNGVFDLSYPNPPFNPPNNLYGGVAIGSDGNLYGVGNSIGPGGNLSKIDLSNYTSANIFNFSPGPSSGQSDMASFMCAPTVTANFNFNGSPCSNTVSFTDASTSSGTISSWNWNFGDPLSGPNNNSTAQNPTHSFSSSGTYPVTLIVTVAPSHCFPGATDTIVSNVTVGNSTLQITPAVLNNVTCFNSCNGNANVTATGGTSPYTYSWSNAQSSQNASGLCAGTYSVTVTDAGGCSGTAQINITQPAAITLSTSVAAASCSGNNGTATVNSSGGTGPYSYSWNTIPSQTNQTATGLSAGNYIVTVTDSNSCTQTASVVIISSGGLIVQVQSVNNVSCSGSCNGSASVTQSGGNAPFIYSWNTIPVQTTATATGLCAGTYSVNITDVNGCSGTNSVTVTQPSILTANIPAVGNSCSGQSLTIFVSAAGGTSPYNYSWNSSQTTSSIIVSPPVSTTYVVTVIDANGCSIIDSIAATVNPLPVVSFSADTLQGCAPLCVNFTDLTPGIINSQWTFGDGGNSALNDPSHCYTAAGNYNVSLFVTDGNGCSNTLTLNNYINVFAAPTATFTTNAQTYSITDPQVCFVNQSTGATSWTWNFSDPLDPSTSNLQDPCHTYSDTGTYCVTLQVKNAGGCTDVITQCLRIEPDFTFYAPNAFTPDGNGNNDFFIPKGSGWDENTFQMWIFDRWGNMIFTSENIGKPWDGHANGGTEIAQIDTYVWKIKMKDLNGKAHDLIGHVSLIK